MVNRDLCRIIRTTRPSLSRERRLLLYGYYNSEQPLIQVKICTAVDKEKGRRTKCHLAFSADFQKKIKSAENLLTDSSISAIIIA